jgi:hypothetical protein
MASGLSAVLLGKHPVLIQAGSVLSQRSSAKRASFLQMPCHPQGAGVMQRCLNRRVGGLEYAVATSKLFESDTASHRDMVYQPSHESVHGDPLAVAAYNAGRPYLRIGKTDTTENALFVELILYAGRGATPKVLQTTRSTRGSRQVRRCGSSVADYGGLRSAD